MVYNWYLGVYCVYVCIRKTGVLVVWVPATLRHPAAAGYDSRTPTWNSGPWAGRPRPTPKKPREPKSVKVGKKIKNRGSPKK